MKIKVLRPDDTRPMMWWLNCPVCEDYCVEQMGPAGEQSAVTVHPDLDEYDSPVGTRGGWTQVRLFCPAGHGFDLITANHKGSQAIAIVPAGYRDYSSATRRPLRVVQP
jgi:hypothetical protein